MAKFIDILGLIFALMGVSALAFGLIVSRKRALQVGVSRISEESDEQNIKLPHVQDEIRESRFAMLGLILLAVGFLLQIIGTLAQ